MGFLGWLESTWYAEWVSFSIFGWPIMLGAHSLGLATIVGIVIVTSLRLLGLYTGVPCTTLYRFMPIAWTGFTINLISGLSLFITQADYYVTNGPFLTKMLFIVLGTVNLAWMHKVLKRDAAIWDATGTVPRTGTLLAAGSLLFWGFAVVTGRLIAYL